MKAPAFWWTPPDAPGWRARALAPLGRVYAAATARRVARPGHAAAVPVICVGNLTAGGAGKTPTVAWLAERLSARAPHVVSRGHGGRLDGPVRVDPARHTAADVGDEPLLLSAWAPVWVARDRAAGVRAAEAAGAGAILLDDGFQNPAVAKTLSILVIDAATGFGNGRCVPAGPLREPPAAGLARADAALVLGPDADRARFLAAWRPRLPAALAEGRIAPLETGMDWTGTRVFAFAGIARPDKVWATLRDLGADIAGTRALDDHQPITPALFARLAAEARALKAQLVTTEKDAVRLPPDARAEVMVLPVRLRLVRDDGLTARIDAAVR